MNVGKILNIVGDMCDLNPKQSPEARARFLRFLNLSMQDLKADMPYLLRSNERRYVVPTQIKPTASERFDVQGDAWVLKLDSTDAAAVGQWRLDGTHATQCLYLTDSAGTQRKRVIQGVLLSGGEIYVSITEPWVNTTDTGLNWEVRTDDFYLPREIETIRAVRIADEVNTWSRDVELLGENEGRALNNRLYQGNPWTAYPGGDQDLPQIGDLSLTVVAQAGAWATFPPAQGKRVSYVFTLSLGSRPELLPRPAGLGVASGRAAPLIESPPCAAVTSENNVSIGSALRVEVPDMRLLFAQSTGLRSDPDLVGYKINIYRAEEGKRFLYLTSLPAGTTTFDDDGTVIPDMFRPLPKAFGAKSLTFDGIPTEGDQIIVDAVWGPLELYSDEDTPALDDTGIRALIELTVEKVQRKLGNNGAAMAARQRLINIQRGLATSYGSGRDPSRPSLRVTRRIGINTHYFYPRHVIDYDWGN
jgi:hypothetical protein